MRIRVSTLLALAFLVSTTTFAAPKPAAKGHGLDLAGMDRSVKPGDDFFAFANNQWVKTTVIPPDRSSTGVFVTLNEAANRRTQSLIQNAGKAKAAKGSEVGRSPTTTPPT